jgi:hypothetical protein
VGFDTLVSALWQFRAEVRCRRLIDITGHKGRPRVRWQMEELDQGRRPVVEALHAVPAID